MRLVVDHPETETSVRERRIAGVAVLVARASRPLAASELSAGEIARMCALPSDHRRRQWLTARHALRVAASRAGLPSDTAAYDFPHARVSLSHTGSVAVAAAVVGDVEGIVGVGIDLEINRRVRLATARFFLGANEQAWLTSRATRTMHAELLRLWTVKEALYKADPANGSAVLADYAVEDPSPSDGRAYRRFHPSIVLRYSTEVARREVETVAIAFATT